MSATCVTPGCNAPRMVSPKTGKVLTMCETHQREYWRGHKTTDKPSYKAARATAERRPRQPKPKTVVLIAPKTETPDRKIVLIDSATGEVWSVTAVRSYDVHPIKRPETLEVLRAAGCDILYVTERDVKGVMNGS